MQRKEAYEQSVGDIPDFDQIQFYQPQYMVGFHDNKLAFAFGLITIEVKVLHP